MPVGGYFVEGKPWSPELEKELTDIVDAKTSLFAIAKKLGKPEEAVRQKIRRLGLEVVEQKKIVCSTTSLNPKRGRESNLNSNYEFRLN